MLSRLAACLLALGLLAPHLAQGQPFVPGIDVSIYQDAIDWDQVKASGVEFAIVRATRGETYDDPLFLANMRLATEAGVRVGAYHFCNLDTDTGNPLDPVNEANHFLRVIKPYYDAGQMLPPVADVEGFPAFGTTAEAKAYTSAWTQTFSDTIYASLGVRPMIYTSLSKANSYYTSPVASQHDLWLAWWKSTGTANPPVASDTPLWGIWQFWQWTDNWTVPGITGAVDGDLFNGTSAQLDGFLHGNGPLGGLPQGRLMLSDFDSSEGYLNSSPTYSGSNQNVLTSSTADFTTTTAYEGAGSEQIFVDTAGGAWALRFVSGRGATAATPAANFPIDSTGSVGFWLKTSNAGVAVQILIDDPTAANPSAIEGGVSRAVIADGAWHLYEWSLPDAAQWNNYAGGGDGAITGARVTIDSLRFTGTNDATIFLDSLSFNPLGSLAPVAGDFNGDLLVNAQDFAIWKAAYGTTAAGDANSDGQSNGADFLKWQRAAQVASAAAAAATIPEPTTIVAAATGMGALVLHRLAARARRVRVR